MIIKQLLKSNVGDILQLNNGNFSDGWTENMLLTAFDGGRFVAFGAFIDERLVGAVTLSLSIDDADIEGVVVDKAYRQKGIGILLMQKAHEYIKNNLLKAVLLEVRQSNLPAIALYEKLGYKKISVRKNYYLDGENALVMIKEF